MEFLKTNLTNFSMLPNTTKSNSLLYDFAVVAIKFCYKRGKLNNKLLNKLQKRILLIDKSLTKQDFNNAIKFYLCKILLEKFYLHINKKINLFSARQQQDPFQKYFNLLKNLNI